MSSWMKMIFDVCKEMVEKLGYALFKASSGEEAVKLLPRKDQAIDLVLLDIIMQGINGQETFNRPKSIKPGLKVLLASGYSLDEKAFDIMKKGCDGFIKKLYKLEELSKKLKSILD